MKKMFKNQAAQDVAKKAMEAVVEKLVPGMTEAQIAALAENEMSVRGAEGWWYHNVGALVLVGEKRCKLSISGREYRPDERTVLGENDMVSLDFSPIVNGQWGDYARTIYMENRKAKLEPEVPDIPEFAEGYKMELLLHQELMEWVRKETTYHQAWEHMNRILRDLGYENMDFHGNLGHSIEIAPGDRIYLEEGNHETLGGHETPFTFEPHIAKMGGKWGFKREQIYCFGEDGKIRPL